VPGLGLLMTQLNGTAQMLSAVVPRVAMTMTVTTTATIAQKMITLTEVTVQLSETTTAVLCPAAPSAPGPGLPTTLLSGTAQMQSVDANPLPTEKMTETLKTTTTSMTSQPTNTVLAAVKTPTLPSVTPTATTASCPGLPTTQTFGFQTTLPADACQNRELQKAINTQMDCVQTQTKVYAMVVEIVNGHGLLKILKNGTQRKLHADVSHRMNSGPLMMIVAVFMMASVELTVPLASGLSPLLRDLGPIELPADVHRSRRSLSAAKSVA